MISYAQSAAKIVVDENYPALSAATSRADL